MRSSMVWEYDFSYSTSCYVVNCRFLSRVTARYSPRLRMSGLLLPAFSYCFQPEPLSFRLVQCENLQFLFLSLPRFALSAGGSALLFYQCSNALPWSWPCRLLRGGSTGTTPGLGASSRYLSKNWRMGGSFVVNICFHTESK